MAFSMVEPVLHGPGHPVLHGGADIDVGKAAKERLSQIVSGAGFAALITGSHNAGVGRQRPAVVDKALQHYLEDDRLGLLCGVGQLVEEEDVDLAVLAELFKLANQV